jgi:DNA-binding transcriptional LysR family regulator
MKFSQMTAFRTLMFSGSVTSAARLLRLSQPTVSKLIAQLETQTHLKLFERRRRRLVPTREAHTLLKSVEKALSAMDDVSRTATELSRTHSGMLRIACIPSIGGQFMPTAIANFLKTHADIKATLYVRTANHIIDRVSGALADLGLVSDDVDEPGIESCPFQEYPGAICILPPRHRLRNKKVIRVTDLEGESFISVGSYNKFRHRIDQTFVEASVSRNIVVEATHLGAAYVLVAEGMGVSVIDPYTAIAGAKRHDVVLRPFLPEVKFVVNLLTPINLPVPTIVEDFKSHLFAEQKAMQRLIQKLIQPSA